MIDWKKNLREGLGTGTLAGLFSAAVLLMTGKRETGSAAAAVNAESHWLWGRVAARGPSNNCCCAIATNGFWKA